MKKERTDNFSPIRWNGYHAINKKGYCKSCDGYWEMTAVPDQEDSLWKRTKNNK